MRVAIGAALITASALIAFWIERGLDEGLGSPVALLALTVAFALSWLYPLLTLWKEETVAFSLDEALFVFTAILLPPVGVLLAFGAGSLIAQLIRKRPLNRVAFNTSQLMIATGLGLAAVRARLRRTEG